MRGSGAEASLRADLQAPVPVGLEAPTLSLWVWGQHPAVPLFPRLWLPGTQDTGETSAPLNGDNRPEAHTTRRPSCPGGWYPHSPALLSRRLTVQAGMQDASLTIAP